MLRQALSRTLRVPMCVPSHRSFCSEHASSSPHPSESFVSGTNASYLEAMELAYRKDPNSVHHSWRVFFEAVDRGEMPGSAFVPPPGVQGLGSVSSPVAAHSSSSSNPSSSSMGGVLAGKGGIDLVSTLDLIRAYQTRGHVVAKTCPLGFIKHDRPFELSLESYGLSAESVVVLPERVGASMRQQLVEPGKPVSVADIVEKLESTYCGSIGFEYMHIANRDRCNWLRERIESYPRKTLSAPERKTLFKQLARAHLFESTLRKKYPSQKGFGMEGAWSFIPGVRRIIDAFHKHGGTNIMFGAAHRGRLAFLSEVMNKPRALLFKEFNEGGPQTIKSLDFVFSGDVKYHVGASTTFNYEDEPKNMYMTLLPNPSHLEAVDPVVEGKARARAHFLKDEEFDRVMSVIVHGDASFAGQGVVSETMELSGLSQYRTGGTVHIVINNRIGFTTNPRDARTSQHPTDIAKSIGAPIFHVNGDDVDAVAHVCDLAVEWRQKFKTDVVIDLVTYRKHGHNEGDMPHFTQPHMYSHIDKAVPTLDIYSAKLIEEGVLTKAEVNKFVKSEKAAMQKSFKEAPTYEAEQSAAPSGSKWSEMNDPGFNSPAQTTGMPKNDIQEIIEAVGDYPEGFDIHPQVRKIIDARRECARTGVGIDWGTAEAMAYASLLAEGTHVRISGQDVERGTFSHRHAVLHSQTNHGPNVPGGKHIPLAAVKTGQGQFTVTNSSLSEFAVLGFEFGYSLEDPNSLVIWEAQFGDFANSAQVMIDQFVTCAESKWHRQSALTMLLPHGYEHGGPEHSSARPERFLQLFDDDHEVANKDENVIQKSNIQVVNCSTPANYFHVIRRQIHRNFRKPLIVIAPKALLKHKSAQSTIEEFVEGTSFLPVIVDTPENSKSDEDIRKVVFCSGKVGVEFKDARQAREADDIAIVRLEQLAPFPYADVEAAIARFPNAEFVFAQEENKNGGFWTYAKDRLQTAARQVGYEDLNLQYIGRAPSGPPATGNAAVSKAEETAIFDKVFS